MNGAFNEIDEVDIRTPEYSGPCERCQRLEWNGLSKSQEKLAFLPLAVAFGLRTYGVGSVGSCLDLSNQGAREYCNRTLIITMVMFRFQIVNDCVCAT